MRNYIWTGLKDRYDGSMLKGEGDNYSQLRERNTQSYEDVKEPKMISPWGSTILIEHGDHGQGRMIAVVGKRYIKQDEENF